MQYIISLLLISLSTALAAQTEHFRVIDHLTQKPIYGVKIKSFASRDLVTFSNDSGYFNIKVSRNDTISISKDYYYTMYLSVNKEQLDTLHTIYINMIPSKTEKNTVLEGNLSALQFKEYQFTHTSGEESKNVTVQVHEPTEAVDIRTHAGEHNDFRFKTWNVDAIHINHHHGKSNSQYK